MNNNANPAAYAINPGIRLLASFSIAPVRLSTPLLPAHLKPLNRASVELNVALVCSPSSSVISISGRLTLLFWYFWNVYCVCETSAHIHRPQLGSEPSDSRSASLAQVCVFRWKGSLMGWARSASDEPRILALCPLALWHELRLSALGSHPLLISIGSRIGSAVQKQEMRLEGDRAPQAEDEESCRCTGRDSLLAMLLLLLLILLLLFLHKIWCSAAQQQNTTTQTHCCCFIPFPLHQ